MKNPEDLEPVVLTSECRIARAEIAIPALVAEITGRDDIPPAAFKQEPQGHRMTVLLDRPPETYGSHIVIPESFKSLNPVGAGIIIGVGPLAGSEGVPYPGGPVCHPSQLLYRHICFGQHSGSTLRLTVRESKYEAAVLFLNSRDIWAIDWDDDPYAEEREEMRAFAEEQDRKAREEKAAEERLKAEKLRRKHFVEG